MDLARCLGYAPVLLGAALLSFRPTTAQGTMGPEPADNTCHLARPTWVAYRAGFAQGRAVVRTAWQVRRQACTALEEVASAVRRQFGTEPPAAARLACRHRGLRAGAEHELTSLELACSTPSQSAEHEPTTPKESP